MSTEKEIGYLSSKVETLTKQSDTQFELIRNLSKTTTEMHTLLKTHAERAEERHTNMESDIRDCKEGVQEYRRDRYKLMGIIAGISAAVSGGVSKLTDLFS